LDRVSIVSVEGQYLFFQHFDGPYFPTLKLLHRYPDILPKIQVDRGAIKFVLKGADIMCPGMTSPGARLPTANLPKDSVVAIYAEGKEHALAVGLTTMSVDEIKTINKGTGVQNMHVILDGLWATLK
ncbi:translation machinery-associated protein 20, partial [Kappamyces sp. JEL0680]